MNIPVDPLRRQGLRTAGPDEGIFIRTRLEKYMKNDTGVGWDGHPGAWDASKYITLELYPDSI